MELGDWVPFSDDAGVLLKRVSQWGVTKGSRCEVRDNPEMVATDGFWRQAQKPLDNYVAYTYIGFWDSAKTCHWVVTIGYYVQIGRLSNTDANDEW